MNRFPLVLSILLLAACSTTRKVGDLDKRYEGSLTDRSVAVVVTPPDEKGDHADVVRDVQAELIARLMGSSKFARVVSAQETSDLDLTVRLNHVGEVSGTSRVMWGALAGSNDLSAAVRLTDKRTSETLCSFTVKASSAAHPFSGASDLKDAVRELANAIIEQL